MLRLIARNVAANWVNALVAALLALVVTPYLVEGLKSPEGGNEAYGVWTFIVGLTAYFGLLDLGFFQGVLQFFTRYRTLGDRRRYNSIVSTAVGALGVLAGLATLVAVGVAWSFPSLLEIAGPLAYEMRLACFLVALSVIVRLPLQVFSAVIVGCNSFHVLNGIVILGRVVTAGGVLGAMMVGGGVLGVAVATLMGSLVTHLGHLWAAFRVEPGLRVRLGAFDWATLRETVTYGKWMFGSRLYDLYLANIDLILVPLLFGAEAIAVYGLAVGLVSQAQLAVQGYTFALTPSAIAADAREGTEALRSVLVTSSRIGLMLAGGMFLVAWLWGERFIYVWLQDPSFLWEAEYVSAAKVLAVVALDRLFLQGLAGPQQTLIGMRRVRELCLVKVAQGVVSVVLAYILGRQIGILAVPWALLAGSLAGRAVLTVLACRATEMALSSFSRQALLPAGTTLIVAGVFAAWLEGSSLSGWTGLIVEVGAFCGLGLLAALAFGLTSSERHALLDTALSWTGRG